MFTRRSRSLTHRGHASLGAVSREMPCRKDKSDLYLLKRWGSYVARDPYFPTNMRDWLYTDALVPVDIYGQANNPGEKWKRDALLVPADLSANSTASFLLNVAEWGRKRGIFPVVIAAKDGPLRSKYHEAGSTVIIDESLCRDETAFRGFARNFDSVIAETNEMSVRVGREENVPVFSVESAPRELAAFTEKISTALENQSG